MTLDGRQMVVVAVHGAEASCSHLRPVQSELQAGWGRGTSQGVGVGSVPHWSRVALLETHLGPAILHSQGTRRKTHNTQHVLW